MKKQFLLFFLIGLLSAGICRADTYSQFLECMDYFSVYSMPPWNYYTTISTYCYPCWYFQKKSINIGFSSSTPGYLSGALPAMFVDPQKDFTVMFETYSKDKLNKIELYIFHRTSSVPTLVGTDTTGSDGWSIMVDHGFLNSLLTSVLIGVGYFEGHSIETDGDMALIFITNSSMYLPNPLPTPPLATPPSFFTCYGYISPVPTPVETPAPSETPEPEVTPDPTPVQTTTPDPTSTPGPTAIPTATPAPTSPPSTGCTCQAQCDSRIVITVPFTHDGAGEFCWESSSSGTYINSWNTAAVNINGTNFTNMYASTSGILQLDGKFYIYYKGLYSYSHFEMK